jgi:3-hydroxyisobutyrate dehydrogenase
MTTKVGLVGLGRMGRAIYARLTENGCEVMAWDHDARAVKSAAEHRVRLADSPRAVAIFGGFVISTITEDHGVRGLFDGANGFLSGDIRGKLFIEMSTLQPRTGRELAPIVANAGARLIDSPVFGTIPHVREGKLYAMVGGTAADLQRARPVLEKLAHKIAHMGPSGAGYAMKLAVNLGLVSRF